MGIFLADQAASLLKRLFFADHANKKKITSKKIEIIAIVKKIIKRFIPSKKTVIRNAIS